MLNRVLLIVLTSVATCGLETAAIARSLGEPGAERRSAPGIIVSQLDSGDNNDAAQPSPAVQSLQNRLTELGYYEGTVDGVFTDATREALAAFQRDQGLVGTGILDPLTQQRLVNPGGAESPPESATPAPDTAEPSPDADEPAAESAPTLDLPPVSENGEVEAPAATEADAAAEADAATDADPAATGEDAAPGEAADAGEDANAGEDAATGEAAAPETEAADDRPLPLVIIGGFVVVLGLLGIGGMLWLDKRRSKVRTQNSDSVPDHSEQNGKQSVTQEAPPSPLEIRHQSLPIAHLAEPRVAKVNIIDELIQDLHRSDPELRRKAIWELGQRGNSAAVQPLVNLLAEADSHEQGLVLAALAEISSQTLKPMNRAVAIALQNENSEVRKNAIRDLTRIYDSLSQVGRMLGHASLDDDPEVRQTADWALNQLHKMRLSATDTAALLKESDTSRSRLPEDESSPSS